MVQLLDTGSRSQPIASFSRSICRSQELLKKLSLFIFIPKDYFMPIQSHHLTVLLCCCKVSTQPSLWLSTLVTPQGEARLPSKHQAASGLGEVSEDGWWWSACGWGGNKLAKCCYWKLPSLEYCNWFPQDTGKECTEETEEQLKRRVHCIDFLLFFLAFLL